MDKLTPYSLDRIFTRMYYTLNDITPKGTVNNIETSEYISNYILAFWNACIVEDCIVSGKVEGIELGHERSLADIFMHNYWKRFFEQHRGKKSFANWVIGCPLLQSYVPAVVLKFIKEKNITESVVREYMKSNQLDFLLSQQLGLTTQIDLLETEKEENLKEQNSQNLARDNAEKLFDKEVEIQNVTNELAKKNNSAAKNTKLANELSELRKEKRKIEELVFDDENIIIEKQRSLRLSQRNIMRELARLLNKNNEISQQIESLGKVSSKSFQDINQTADNPFSVFVELSK